MDVVHPNRDTYGDGYDAGLDWLATPDGVTYLGPAEDAEVPFYEDAGAGFNQGFTDAVKEAAWHVQWPNRWCHAGPACPARTWWLARQRDAS